MRLNVCKCKHLLFNNHIQWCIPCPSKISSSRISFSLPLVLTLKQTWNVSRFPSTNTHLCILAVRKNMLIVVFLYAGNTISRMSSFSVRQFLSEWLATGRAFSLRVVKNRFVTNCFVIPVSVFFSILFSLFFYFPLLFPLQILPQGSSLILLQSFRVFYHLILLALHSMLFVLLR